MADVTRDVLLNIGVDSTAIDDIDADVIREMRDNIAESVELFHQMERNVANVSANINQLATAMENAGGLVGRIGGGLTAWGTAISVAIVLADQLYQDISAIYELFQEDPEESQLVKDMRNLDVLIKRNQILFEQGLITSPEDIDTLDEIGERLEYLQSIRNQPSGELQLAVAKEELNVLREQQRLIRAQGQAERQRLRQLEDELETQEKIAETEAERYQKNLTALGAMSDLENKNLQIALERLAAGERITQEQERLVAAAGPAFQDLINQRRQERGAERAERVERFTDALGINIGDPESENRLQEVRDKLASLQQEQVEAMSGITDMAEANAEAMRELNHRIRELRSQIELERNVVQ